MSAASRRNNRLRQDAARDVVERARSGDQVAMGILAMVRENAKHGDPKAQQSYRALQRYVSKNPPTGIGAEASDITNPTALAALWNANADSEVIIKALPLVGFWPGVVALSHGPSLANDRLKLISEQIPEEARDSFKGGVLAWQKRPPMEASERGWLLGRIVGLARCIQMVRLPQVPISIFCPVTAWELGE